MEKAFGESYTETEDFGREKFSEGNRAGENDIHSKANSKRRYQTPETAQEILFGVCIFGR